MRALLLVLAGCGGPAPIDSGTPLPDGWAARVERDTAVFAPRADGCLIEEGPLAAGSAVPILATDGTWALIDADGTCVPAADLAISGDPPALEDEPAGVVQLETPRYAYDADGCPVEAGTLLAYEPVLALARRPTANYRGMVAIDHDLGLAPVRAVDAPGWDYPWHASVQLLLPIPSGGFVLGGGVLIGPDRILTAAHLGVDEGWCWCRAPSTGEAYYGGQCVCDGISGPAEVHPDGVDAAIARLTFPEPEPWATIGPPAEPGSPFYTSQWSTLLSHAIADGTVDRLGNDNAFCDPWPDQSSFVATEQLVGGGDSGGPAWIGDGLVGLVHGERCRSAGEPVEHVFVHVPGIADWVDSAQ